LKRLAIGLALGLLPLANLAPASAAPRTLYLSDVFELRARLTPTRLVLTHTNLTNLPVAYTCEVEIEGERHRTHGRLSPHLVWRTRVSTDASRVREASAECTVEVDERFVVFWEGELLEVFGRALTDPNGGPVTYLVFQNISSETVRFFCTWEMGEPPTPFQNGMTHLSSGWSNSISYFGIEFSTVANMTCTEEVYEGG
jgi:hypothetical protein